LTGNYKLALCRSGILSLIAPVLRRDKRIRPLNKPPIKLTFRISRYPDKTPGQKIRKYRLENELKQVDLAKLLNVDEMTIHNWELERTKPGNMLANRINNLLGIEIYPIKALDLEERGRKE